MSTVVVVVNYLAQVQKGVDYIEARLESEISLREVARAAGISQWHFQRIFKALTNETLKTYIRSRRFANALDRLLKGDDRIIEIALGAGFESQQSFTRAFKQSFGMTPNAYRKLGRKSLFLKKVELDEEYLRHLNENVGLEPEIYEQPAITVAGLRTVFYSSDSEKNNIAEKLPPLWEQFLERFEELPKHGAGPAFGVIRQSEGDGEQLEYFAAVEVKEHFELPDGMVSVAIPAATYARFSHRGDPRELDRTVNYIYSTWLTQSGRRHTYGADLETYGDDYISDSSDSVMYYSIPIA